MIVLPFCCIFIDIFFFRNKTCRLPPTPEVSHLTLQILYFSFRFGVPFRNVAVMC